MTVTKTPPQVPPRAPPAAACRDLPEGTAAGHLPRPAGHLPEPAAAGHPAGPAGVPYPACKAGKGQAGRAAAVFDEFEINFINDPRQVISGRSSAAGPAGHPRQVIAAGQAGDDGRPVDGSETTSARSRPVTAPRVTGDEVRDEVAHARWCATAAEAWAADEEREGQRERARSLRSGAERWQRIGEAAR